MHRNYHPTEDAPQKKREEVTRIMIKSENLLLTWLLHLNREKAMTEGELAKMLDLPVYITRRLIKDYPIFDRYMQEKHPILANALKQFMALLPMPVDFTKPQIEVVSTAVKSMATLTLEHDYRNGTLTWFPFNAYLTDEKETPVARINYPGGTIAREG